MSLHSLAPLAFEFRRYLSNPSCPRCGTFLVCPETSEFVHPRQVRHSWACDCGEQFQTTVVVAERVSEASAA
jgi:hypothetical protein